MKVWISKYALTKGLIEIDIDPPDADTPNMVVDKRTHYHVYYSRPDWHETNEGATARAEEMRCRKLESLKKQIRRLEKLKFE